MDSGWVAAGFGLAGVVVGGILNAGVSALFETHGRQRATRSASRLVQGELRLIGSYLHAATTSGTYGPEVNTPLPTEQWKIHSTTLADGLDDDLWDSVGDAYVKVASLGAIITMALPSPVQGGKLADALREVYEGTLQAVSVADDRLCEFHASA